MPSDRQKMAFWVARAAKALREGAGLSQPDIAHAAHVKTEKTVQRLEVGDNLPPEVDRYLAAYGRELGIDPRDIWQDALDAWRKDQPVWDSATRRAELDRKDQDEALRAEDELHRKAEAARAIRRPGRRRSGK